MQIAAETSGHVWAVVPVKRLSRAKQRLAGVLSRNERVKLARTMLHEVLTALCATPEIAGTIVVTGDPMVANLATLFEARVVMDVLETGINGAVQQGLKTLDASSAALVVPADVPFATASDLRDVIGELDRHAVVLVPALSDGGTNALALRSPDLLVPSFGDDSFVRHQALAQASGVDCGIVRNEGLGRDVDCPDDLLPWAGIKKFSLTAALLAEFNIAERLHAAALPASERHV
jgi:2-phospho-L-lactate/phosphoenolpyruvate guanylyltransferase